MYIYIYIYILCVYVCIYIYIYIYTHICIHTYYVYIRCSLLRVIYIYIYIHVLQKTLVSKDREGTLLLARTPPQPFWPSLWNPSRCRTQIQMCPTDWFSNCLRVCGCFLAYECASLRSLCQKYRICSDPITVDFRNFIVFLLAETLAH